MKQAARPRIAIESLDDHRNPSFRSALRLYNRTFPTKEKIDHRYFVELLQEKRLGLLFPFNIHFLVARAGGRVVGLATGSYLAVVNMGFVGYLAATPRMKGARIGVRLRSRLVEVMRRDARASGRADLDAVMGEVEADSPWLRHLVRQRGALALDFEYQQPALGKGSPTVPLVLYMEGVARPIRSVPGRRMQAILYAIQRRVYRMRFPLRGATFRRMFRSLEGRRTVGSRPLPRA